MAKQSGKKDAIDKARRKLAKAQLAWNVADEKLAQARVKGKQEVERARLQEAKWLAKATDRMQRRAAALARAEERLLALSAEQEAALHSPDAAADLVARRETDAENASEQAGSAISLPEGIGMQPEQEATS